MTSSRPCVIQGVTRDPVLKVYNLSLRLRINDLVEDAFSAEFEMSEKCYTTEEGGVVVDSGFIGNISLIGIYASNAEYTLENFAVPTLVYD